GTIKTSILSVNKFFNLLCGLRGKHIDNKRDVFIILVLIYNFLSFNGGTKNLSGATNIKFCK
ncbi:MAG TPA: hypothetical protein PLR70_06120, partial [Candidatus Syntrophosphaera thermopropionivorans]|nr:hypothetical protein [Candidatus Syntrophosphaera thermopropionivorans]